MSEHILSWSGDEGASRAVTRAERRIVRLVGRAQSGDRRAFDRLWRDHRRIVHAVLLAHVPGQDAEDLLQDVAVAAWEGLPSLREAIRFRAWLNEIARNVARRQAWRRRERASDVTLSGADPDGVDPDGVDPAGLDLADRTPDPSVSMEADEVLAVLRSLPECYREPLVMRLVLGHSGPEIAERLGMTKGSVRVNLHRGMGILRSRLGVDRPG